MNDDSEERFLSDMTHDSATDENNQRLALNLSSSPATEQKALELSEMGADSESEDLNISPRCLGIDFVWVGSLAKPSKTLLGFGVNPNLFVLSVSTFKGMFACRFFQLRLSHNFVFSRIKDPSSIMNSVNNLRDLEPDLSCYTDLA